MLPIDFLGLALSALQHVSPSHFWLSSQAESNGLSLNCSMRVLLTSGFHPRLTAWPISALQLVSPSHF